jgi:hypothetical protein
MTGEGVVYSLDENEAFDAMVKFLTAFYKRTNGDMATLMADIEKQADGLTNDPAAWDDWLRFVKDVKEHDEKS